MLSRATWPLASCWVLPFTVSVMPDGLPMTSETWSFSFQVFVEPVCTSPWKRVFPVLLSSPTQQACAAVSRMTASGTVGFFFWAGLDAVLGFAVGVVREWSLTVALAVGSVVVYFG